MKATIRTLRLFSAVFALATALVPARAGLTAATMHPVLTGMVQHIGGDKVKVTSIVAPGADVHHFSPTPADVRKLSVIPLIFVCGRHMENYLDKLRSNLSATQQIIEIGEKIPPIVIGPGDPTFLCCPEHAKDAIDPHWWNGVENMQRAGYIVADVFGEKDPDNKDYYRANAAAWKQKLDDLKKWARKEISVIPPERRKLATAHLSLSYFAKEFGFRIVGVQGLSHDANATVEDLASAEKVVRDHKIVAVFPEHGVNPKYLQQLSGDTGVKIAPELIADGNGTGDLASFEAAFTHNVRTIVAALKP